MRGAGKRQERCDRYVKELTFMAGDARPVGSADNDGGRGAIVLIYKYPNLRVRRKEVLLTRVLMSTISVINKGVIREGFRIKITTTG